MLPITSALNAVKRNQILNVSDLVKKTDYNAKISEIETKYFTAFANDKFTSEILNAKIKRKGLVDKSHISRLIDNSDLDKKIATLARKA